MIVKKFVLKPLLYLFCLVILILIAMAGYGVWKIKSSAQKALPAYDGGITIKGLSTAGYIERDAYGLVTLRANTLQDAYRLQGYAQAQDRFWQMELIRRIGAGRLSEVFGVFTVNMDKMIRKLGLYHAAQQDFATLPAASQRALQAYAEGVNAWLRSHSDRLPPELAVLSITPQPWQPADSMVWQKMMAMMLLGDWSFEKKLYALKQNPAWPQTRERLLWPHVDGPSTIDNIPPANTDTSATAPSPRINSPTNAMAPFQADMAMLENLFPPKLASNAWVSNKGADVLLANDPHLGFMWPSIWYLTRIITPDYTIQGGSMPGVPGIIVGQNQYVSWGLTTTHSDGMDLFIEKLSADGTHYVMPDGSLAALHTREETINVRFSDPVHFTVQQSRHGALISAGDDLSGSLRGTALALSAPHLLPQDRSIHALLQLNTAKSVADARMALADYRAPMQNVFLADHFGNISFIAAGSIPKRGQNTGLGPFNGWETAHDWHGWYPQSANPSLTNPPKGYIANGNNRPWAKPSPYLAHHWKEPYRAQRIIAFLEHPENHTMATFQMMQHDVCSAMMADLIPRVLSYIATDSLSPRGQQWRDTLQQWDGCMTVQSKTPTFAVHWLQFVQDSLLRPEERSVVHTLQPMFIKAALAQHACHAQDCQKIIRAAYHKVLENTPLPTWGEVHQARFNHLPTGMLPIIGAYTATTHPTGGGDFTINRGTFGRLPESGMAWHRHGAGLRTVMNARDLNKSVFSISGGQSGNFLSAFAENLHGKWRNAEGISFTNSIEHRIIAQP